MYYLELVLCKNVLLITSYLLLLISTLQECNTYYFLLIT